MEHRAQRAASQHRCSFYDEKKGLNWRVDCLVLSRPAPLLRPISLPPPLPRAVPWALNYQRSASASCFPRMRLETPTLDGTRASTSSTVPGEIDASDRIQWKYLSKSFAEIQHGELSLGCELKGKRFCPKVRPFEIELSRGLIFFNRYVKACVRREACKIRGIGRMCDWEFKSW